MALSLWQYALYLLARRDYSRGELKKKLLSRQLASQKLNSRKRESLELASQKLSFQESSSQEPPDQATIDDQVVEETLSRLAAQGYLSDARFIESFVRSKVLGQKNGPLKVCQALRAKGISIRNPRQLTQVLGIPPEEECDYWVQQCIEAIQKKWRGKSHYTLKEKASLFAFLQRKGFRLEDIQRAFQECTFSLVKPEPYR